MLIRDTGCRASPGHVIRCVVGSSLRFIVWVSLANVAAAATGRTKGFWAAKVGPSCHAPAQAEICHCNMLKSASCFVEQRMIRTRDMRLAAQFESQGRHNSSEGGA